MDEMQKFHTTKVDGNVEKSKVVISPTPPGENSSLLMNNIFKSLLDIMIGQTTRKEKRKTGYMITNQSCCTTR